MKNKRVIVSLGILVGIILIAAIAYAMDVLANQGKVPRATAIGGVDISGMERSEAVSKLETELGEPGPVEVTAGSKTATLQPADAGLSVDLPASVAAIDDASLNPFSRLASFFKSPTEHDVVTNVDDSQLNPVVEKAVDDLHADPEDGNVELIDGDVKVTDPVLGQDVERATLHDAVVNHWLDPNGVEVDVEEIEPRINDEAIEDFRETAETVVSADLKLEGDGAEAVATPQDISGFVHTKREDGLALDIDFGAAEEFFSGPLAETETPGENAKISFSGGSRNVTPHVDGIVIDWGKTFDGLEGRLTSTDGRTWQADYRDEPAEYTTEDAEHATFDDTIGEFTTSDYSAASGRNIELVAQAVDGAVLSPGETFSLNGYTGPRGAAQGYVESGIIIDGHAGTAVGGGISQFATTLYNASYFAGMEDVAHTPHSYYISRYPAGREATVYEGAIDLQFRNNSDHAVKIETSFGGGDITVRFKGVKTVEVESINNGRWARTDPQPMSVSGSDCSPSSGAPGFTTSDTRVVKDLSGNEISRETTTTVYDPQPIVRCG